MKTMLEYLALLLGVILGTLLLHGCKVPTEYTVHSPECPWPPPRVSDSSVTMLPLGCPWQLEDGTVVPGLPRL